MALLTKRIAAHKVARTAVVSMQIKIDQESLACHFTDGKLVILTVIQFILLVLALQYYK